MMVVSSVSIPTRVPKRSASTQNLSCYSKTIVHVVFRFVNLLGWASMAKKEGGVGTTNFPSSSPPLIPSPLFQDCPDSIFIITPAACTLPTRKHRA